MRARARVCAGGRLALDGEEGARAPAVAHEVARHLAAQLVVTSCKAVPMGQSVTAEKIVVNLVEGLERVGLSMENVFAATKDEGADIAAAFRVTPCVDVPCSAHVQQTCVRRCPHSPLH